jgi:glutamate--cysteine ligase
VTLEPGGQLELSGKFCCDINCSWRDLNRYRQHILAVGHDLGLAFLGLGVQPFTPLDKISWLPKKRYGIMGPYMLKTGDMGQRMMKQSAGIQVNLDFSDEADIARKLRIAQRLSPLSYALFANSPILEDRPSGFLSFRGEIWSRTDRDRCGLIEQLLAPESGLGDFVDYALDVPLYFIERQGEYHDQTDRRLTFRQFLDQGWNGERATLADWNLHLSTLFPEVRLRPQLEVRSADSLPPRYTAAVAAFYKGLLYSEESLARAERLLGDLDREEIATLHRASWKEGLKARVRGGTLQELVVELLGAARQGLQSQYLAAYSSADEGRFLDSIEEIATTGVTLAERLLKHWQGDRSRKMSVLLKHCGYGEH